MNFCAADQESDVIRLMEQNQIFKGEAINPSFKDTQISKISSVKDINEFLMWAS